MLAWKLNMLTRFWNSVCWDGIHRQNRRELQSNYFRSHSCWGEHHTPDTDEWAGFYTPILCPHHKGHLSFSEIHQLAHSLSFILLCICQKISVWLVSMAPLALGNANGELSPGFLELLGSRGCYQRRLVRRPAAHLSLSVCVSLFEGGVCLKNVLRSWWSNLHDELEIYLLINLPRSTWSVWKGCQIHQPQAKTCQASVFSFSGVFEPWIYTGPSL